MTHPPNQPPIPPGHPSGQPQGPQPPRRSRGPLLLVGGLVLLLVLVIVATVVLLVMRSDGDSSAAEPARARPSDPTAVEFRRVLTAKAGTCPTPTPSGTACDGEGNVYTLGKVELDGSNVSEVKTGQQPSTGQNWYVNLHLDPDGTKLFGALTADLAQQEPPANRLAIVVRGEVVAAPTVQSEISGGQVQIAGAYTRETAEALAQKIIG